MKTYYDVYDRSGDLYIEECESLEQARDYVVNREQGNCDDRSRDGEELEFFIHESPDGSKGALVEVFTFVYEYEPSDLQQHGTWWLIWGFIIL